MAVAARMLNNGAAARELNVHSDKAVAAAAVRLSRLCAAAVNRAGAERNVANKTLHG